MSDPAAEPMPPYDPEAIFHEDGPINPSFIHEAVRTLMRALPLEDPDEPEAWGYRRMHSAMRGLSALHPRNEIEVMLGVQTLCAYHAAAACWRLGMNLRHPHGDSTRHVTTAATAARTFDTMLKAVERRQAKPLSVPVGRPAPRKWDKVDPTSIIQALEQSYRDEPDPESERQAAEAVVWTPQALALAAEMRERERFEEENKGLDLANTEGILPGGGMIMPADPTPQQHAYMARRVGLMYKREHAENLRNGIKTKIKIRPLRTGDLIP